MPSIDLSFAKNSDSGAKSLSFHALNLSPAGTDVITYTSGRKKHNGPGKKVVGNYFWIGFMSNFVAQIMILTLKSRLPPQTTLSTFLHPSTALRAGKISFNAFCASARDFLSLSSDHLHRHSRAMVSKSTPSTKDPI